MEEANTIQGASAQPSIAPAPSDLPQRQAEPASSSDDNLQGGQSQQRADQDEKTSSYKASEIAGHFIEVIDPEPHHVDTAAPIDVVRDRRATAFADLQSARAELASLEKERAAAAADADAVMARARKTAAISQEAGKAVEDLAAELVALKKELESSNAAHGEAEEKRMALAEAFEHDKAQWQSELEEAQQEAKKLREELMAACDLEMKTEAAVELLESLKADLLLHCTVEEETLAEEKEKPTEQSSTKAMLEKTNKELLDVKESIEKAKREADCLRFAAASIRDTLEREKAELAALQRNKETAASSIASLEEELNRTTAELAAAEARAKELHDESKMTEQIGEARREAEQAKEKAWSAREEASKAREEASVAKVAVAATKARLEALTQEILAANASEEMATATTKALLQEISKPSEKDGVRLTMDEYNELSQNAREMEDAAGKRVVEAVKLIKEAKDAEVRSLEKLHQLAKQTEHSRQALQAATEEAEEAEFAKLSAERELRQWRAEQEQQPRAGLAEISALDDPGSVAHGNPHIFSPRGYMPRADVVMAAGTAAAEAEARQKKNFFPRMIMFLARKRAQDKYGK